VPGQLTYHARGWSLSDYADLEPWIQAEVDANWPLYKTTSTWAMVRPPGPSGAPPTATSPYGALRSGRSKQPTATGLEPVPLSRARQVLCRSSASSGALGAVAEELSMDGEAARSGDRLPTYGAGVGATSRT
jgi:hypothetical protein